MTNKEAIEVLKKLKKGINLMNAFVGEEDKDLIDIEALDFAIKAFEFINENYPKTFIDYLNGEQI